MDRVFLVVGLGNPGPEYEGTRHNAGFLATSRLAARQKAAWSLESKFEAKLARFQQGGVRVMVCQPLTYMNASGDSVGALMEFFRIQPGNLMVLVDDADLPLGSLRLRVDGSAGGHHGLESIEKRLSSRMFARQKIGIGRRTEEGRDIKGHVLGRISQEEWIVLDRVLERSCDQVGCWLMNGVAKAMNEFNGTLKCGPDEKKT